MFLQRYWVKPFKMDRLRQTLERLYSTPSVKSTDQLSCEPRSQPTVPSEFTRLFRDGSKTVVLNLKDILFITREGRRTVVYHTNGQLETNESLKTLSEEFNSNPFMRTHKGFIVNAKMVREVVPVGRWTYELIMDHTTQRPLLAKGRYQKLEQIIGGKRT